MGMTLWFNNRLDDQRYECDETDLSEIFNHADVVDSICSRAGVKLLSTFFDDIDVRANMTGHVSDWIAADAHWHDPIEGLKTVGALLTNLRDEADGDDALIDELKFVEWRLLSSVDTKQTFHLLLVM